MSAQLNRPYHVFVDPEGDLYIADVGNHRIRHVDSESGVITTIAGQGEYGYSGDRDLATNEKLRGGFAVVADANMNLYISEFFGHRIRRVGPAPLPRPPQRSRTADLRMQASQIFGRLPESAISPENPLTPAKLSLGRRLFHEPALSRDGTVSCADCHPLDKYGMDGLRVAEGIGDQRGDRNTPSVFNAALQDSQFWDGRATDVESQAAFPILNPLEMGMPNEAAAEAAIRAIPAIAAHFDEAFPGQEQPVNFTNIRLALGAFQRKLLTPDSRFDRFIAGASDALSETELLGLEVYLREGCASCHAGPLMGGQDILLIEDYLSNPMGDRFEFRKKLGNSHKFKVSPLRNIGVTAPYLHDGRYASLAESLGGRLAAYQVHEAGITDTVEFSDTEFSALLAFLGSLTGKIDFDYIQFPQSRTVAVQGPRNSGHPLQANQ